MRTYSLKPYAPLLATFIVLVLPLIPLVAFGAPDFGPPNGSTGIGNPSGSTATLQNPLKATNFCVLVKTVLDAILIIGMPIAVLFMVWVGFKFILAQGNPAKISEAQKNLLNTVIGIAIFLGAWTIAKIIASTLQNLGVSAVNECVR